MPILLNLQGGKVKKLLTTIFIACMVAAPLLAATGSKMQYATFTTTGTHSVSFNFKTTEVSYVRVSTNACQISYTDALCDSTTNYEYVPAVASGAVSHSEDIQTTKMSIWSDQLPVNIQIRGKGW